MSSETRTKQSDSWQSRCLWLVVPAGTSAEGSLPAEEDSRLVEGSHPVASLAVEGNPVPGTAAEGSLQKHIR